MKEVAEQVQGLSLAKPFIPLRFFDRLNLILGEMILNWSYWSLGLGRGDFSPDDLPSSNEPDTFSGGFYLLDKGIGVLHIEAS
jgi:hypothetical protein